MSPLKQICSGIEYGVSQLRHEIARLEECCADEETMARKLLAEFIEIDGESTSGLCDDERHVEYMGSSPKQTERLEALLKRTRAFLDHGGTP